MLSVVAQRTGQTAMGEYYSELLAQPAPSGRCGRTGQRKQLVRAKVLEVGTARSLAVRVAARAVIL